MSTDNLIERIARVLAAQASASDYDAFIPQAREIIAAMRVPSRRMTKAGAEIPVGCCMTNSSDAGEVWEYMIDAAIAEPGGAAA